MHSALNMEEYWEERDVEIAQSPMPPEFKNRKVKVLVNCGELLVQIDLLVCALTGFDLVDTGDA